MGYLHFDRVKIPQENLIFNDSSSIQLSSVNRLLKENGIVLRNDDGESAQTKEHGNFDDFLKNIIAINTSENKSAKEDSESKQLFSPYSLSASTTAISPHDGSSLQSLGGKETITSKDNVSLSLDEEIGWNGITDVKAFLGQQGTISSNSGAVSIGTSFACDGEKKCFSEKKMLLLDIQQLKGLSQIPGFKELKEQYQCTKHKHSKRGRGRKLKCCQTADDLFKIALRKKCEGMGIHDFSKYRRGRGRPKKATGSFDASLTSTSTEEENVLSEIKQKKDLIAAGSVMDQCNNKHHSSHDDVQYKLSLMQKQLEDQQLRLNEQINNMNKQQLPFSGLMALLQQQQPAYSTNFYTPQVPVQVQQPHISQYENTSLKYLAEENHDSLAASEFSFANKPNLNPQFVQSSLTSNLNSHLESILSPMSLNTPGMVSPSHFNYRGSIPNINSMLKNDLINNSSQPVQPHMNISAANQQETTGASLRVEDVEMEDVDYYRNDHFHDVENPSKFESNKVSDLPSTAYVSKRNSDAEVVSSLEDELLGKDFDDASEDDLLKGDNSKKNAKKSDKTNKRLQHISGRTIEVDPVTKKMKCFFEGCNSQFKEKAYLSRHMKRHSPIKDYLCPFWSKYKYSQDRASSCVNHKSAFEKSLLEKDLLKHVNDKSMNRYVSTLQCHSKGFFTRKDEFLNHLRSYHVASDFKEMPGYSCCVECGQEFSSMKEWYESHINELKCPGIINKDFNKGKALRRKYEREIRKKVTQHETEFI